MAPISSALLPCLLLLALAPLRAQHVFWNETDQVYHVYETFFSEFTRKLRPLPEPAWGGDTVVRDTIRRPPISVP